MSLKLFDHLNAIYTNQRVDYFETLDDADKKTYEPYMINRFISMVPAFVPVVNEVNKYYGIVTARESYLFYSQLLPKGKHYEKYVKATKTETYEPWLVELIAQYFKVSKNEATDYLTLYYLTGETKADLRNICQQHGIEPKLLKKAGL